MIAADIPLATRHDDGGSPAWVRDLDLAYAEAVTCDDDDAAAWGFVALAEPLLRRAAVRLRGQIAALEERSPSLPFDPTAVIDILAVPLFGALRSMLTRTLVLELHVARLEGRIGGEGAAERFAAFLRSLRQQNVARAIFQEYPELARALAVRVDQWRRASGEFLERLCADHAALRAAFAAGAGLGPLVEYGGGAGDTHRDGRSVAVLRFASGLRVVYKPRSLAVDRRFQELLAWLNRRGLRPTLRPLTVLDRGPYGWAEFVEAAPCAGEDGIRRFYERQGAYLALLTVLRATDLHSENVIAAGEQPTFVDLESLFVPRMVGAFAPSEPAAAAAERSVLRLGLLPQRRWGRDGRTGLDVSGLGGEGGQLYPTDAPMLEASDTEDVRVVRRPATLEEGQHRPTLSGAAIVTRAYLGEIERGFRAMHRLLVTHREALLAEDGPLARFAGVETRAIIRNTRSYAELLAEGTHPDVLRDRAERVRHFDRLRAATRPEPWRARAVDAELADLDRGDVPMFTTRPDSHDLWTSNGVRIEACFDEPGLDLTRDALVALDDEDCERQIALIRAAFAGDEQWRDGPRTAGTVRDVPVTAERLLSAARAAGEEILRRVIRADGFADWIEYIHPGEGGGARSLGLDLYGGLPGVTLFLAQLGAVTGDERFSALARESLRTMHERAERSGAVKASPGAFEGWGGLIYCYARLGSLWGDAGLLAAAQQIVEELPAMIATDGVLDVIGGSAGCIGALLALQRVAPSARVLRTAVAAGDRLLAAAESVGNGLGWRTPAGGGRALTGFSHGAGGIAWALLRLSDAAGEPRFRAAAERAIAYERSLYSKEEGNWPDLRGEQEAWVSLWCHGAAGIGLARLDTLPLLDTAATRAEIEGAVETTLRSGFGGRHVLCHGDLGNLELVVRTAESFGCPAWRADAARLAAATLADIESNGWRVAAPRGLEPLGLMNGIAGIGYGLLRLALPERVPSVLTLEPPHLPN